MGDRTVDRLDDRSDGGGRDQNPIRSAGHASSAGDALLAGQPLLHEVAAALRESEAFYRALFEQSHHGVAVFDGESLRVVSFNDAACRQLGYTREEFARLGVPDFEASETPADVAAHRDRMLAVGFDSFRTKHRRKDGEVRDVAVTVQVVQSDGRPCFHCAFEDVTERQRIEETRRASQAWFRQFVLDVPAGIAMFDRDMRYMLVSRRWLADYRLGERDLIGRSHYEVFPEIPDRWKAIHRRCLAGAVEAREEDEFVRADGTVDWLRWEIQPWRESRGEIGGIVIFSEIVTERKRAEEARRASEARLEESIALTPSGYVRYDRDRHVVHANRAWLDLYGYDSAAEVIGRHHDEFAVPHHHHLCERMFEQLLAGGTLSAVLASRRRKDGSTGYHRLSARPIARDGEVVGFEGFLSDSTAERRAALAAEADRLRLATLAELGQLRPTSLTVPQICETVLERSLELTRSGIGYVFLYDESTEILTNYAWSQDAMAECGVADKQTVYELAKAGLWGDAIRERRPIVTNDYSAPNPRKRGHPAGHVAFSRHLGLPVFDGERIVALIGVGNKEEPYDDGDVLQLQQLMDGVWRIVERTRAAESSAAYTRRLEVLRELDRQILAARSVEEIAKLAAESLTRLLPGDGVVVTRLDVPRAAAEVIAYVGPDIAGLELGARSQIRRAIAPEPSTMAETVYRPDLAALPERPPLLETVARLGLRSLVSAPLHTSGETLGFIHVGSFSPHAFRPEHLEVASDVANQVAIGMRQAQLREEVEGERDLLRVLMDSAEDVIYFKDAESRFVRDNRAHVDMLAEYQIGSVIGKTDADFLDPESARQALADEREIIRTGRPILGKIERVVTTDGRLAWLSTSKVPWRDASGRIVGTVGIGRDVTEQRRAEESIRESQAKYRTLFESSADAIFLIDRADGRILEANAAASRIYGYSHAELLTMVNTDVSAEPNETRAATRETRSFIPIRYHRKKDGTVFPVEITAGEMTLGDGRDAHIVAARDIGERLQAESELRASEERFRGLFAQSPIGIELYDRQGRLVDANAADLAIFGISDLAEALGFSMFDNPNVPAEARARLLAGETVRYEHHFDFEPVHRLKLFETSRSGRMFLDVLLSPRRGPDGECVGYIAQIQDVTARRRAERAVLANQRRLEVLQQLDRRILDAQSADEIAEFAVRQIRALVPCDRASVGLFDAATNASLVAAVDEDLPLGRPLGTMRPLSEHGDAEYERAGPTRYMPDTLKIERPWVSLNRLIACGVRSLLSAPLIASDELFGSINLMSVEPDAFADESRTILREIADHAAVGFRQVALREALRRQNAELEERVAERTRELREVNAELSSFAYSVSHDLRAPLRALRGYADILLDEFAEQLGDEGRVFAERIGGAAGRMDGLVQDVLAFSRVTRENIVEQPVRLERVVDDALGQLEAQLAERGARVEVARPLPTVRGHSTILVQVLANLIGNGAKYVAEGVRPEVRVSAEASPTEPGFVRVWVRDNGIGIAPENQDRVFAPFERLHGMEEYPGNGLGLAIVRKGVERLGGRAGVESALGAGSRFWFELPTRPPSED